MVINLFLSRNKFDKLQLIKYNIYMSENLSQEVSEFKIFGMSMESLSIGYGLFLIIWGIIISFISGSDSFYILYSFYLRYANFDFFLHVNKNSYQKENVYAYSCFSRINCFNWWFRCNKINYVCKSF